VVELDPAGGAADPATAQLPLAAPAVAEHHGSLHVRRDGVALRGRRRLPGRLDEPFPLRAPREEEVEPGLEDVLHARARPGVGQSIPRGVELPEEEPGDGHVEAAQVGRERHGLVPLLRGAMLRWLAHRRRGGERFYW